MATFIHGIAASENIDSSGERISILGMDISSLDKDGVFNWEHKADQPGQIVGKVLKARKIFSEKDCEDDHQLYFWQKCQTPYLYVMGELFDDYKESAKEVAGMFRYDQDHKDQNERTVMNFSIEGAKIEKQGMDIVKSIARKVTLTALPCNKAAIAEMVPAEQRKKKDNVDELFKTEEVQAEIFKGEVARIKKDDGLAMGASSALSGVGPSSPSLAGSEMKKDQPKLTVASANTHIGNTGSGKPISATGRIHEYKDFSAQDHRDAANTHLGIAHNLGESNFKQASFHRNKGLLHQAAANTLSDHARKSGSIGRKKSPSFSGQAPKTVFDPHLSGKITPPGPIRKSELSSLSMDEETNTLMNRMEDKYLVSRSALDYLTQAIKENLKKGDIDTDVRYNTNRSIYLDNEDLDSLKDGLNGKKPRIKIRIRQYSPNGEGWEQVAYIEIKAKEADGMSNKIRIRIFDKDVEPFTSGHPIKISEELVNINKDISREVLEKRISTINHLTSLYGYRKQIEIQYERRAYMDEEVRITIDDDLRFMGAKEVSAVNALAAKSSERWVNILQLDHKIKNEGFLILEVKHQGDIPKWVKKCLENCNALHVKFSKYCGAMTAVIETKKSEGKISSYVPFDVGMSKALDAGSAMAAPSQLVGGAALAKEDVKMPKKDFIREHKHLVNVLKHPTKKKLTEEAKDQSKELKEIKKSKWLTRAESDYKSWTKREEFESFMSKRMPHLTKGEIRAIGQVIALNKSMTLEKALSTISGYEPFGPLAKAGGEDSIFTLILFEGCDLHDILHCSHFATDAMTPDTYKKIEAACDEYFEKDVESKELEFKEAGELGKHKQKVLFLTEGNPYKDLFDKLDAVAPYKYSKFRPHISVTTNVDEFKGKAASLVISVNGEVKKKYDFKK